MKGCVSYSVESPFRAIVPKLMLGTKWPSMTSMWSQSMPFSMAAWQSAWRFPKSAERIEGASWGWFITVGRVTKGLLNYFLLELYCYLGL